MLTLEEKHKMQSKEIHSILWLNYSTWSSSPTICWKALKSTSPNRHVSFCLTLGMWKDGHWNYNTKKKKTQRRANLILVDWKVHQMLAIKIICHNLQNYWNHHIFFWESIGLEHWEDKIWGSVWIRIPPLKNNPAMNMKWRNICVYIYIYVMFWATKLAGTQIFVSNIVGILLGEPRTFLLNPPKKIKHHIPSS